MSGIRKFRRIRSRRWRPKGPPARLPLRDILLVCGCVAAIVGLLAGGREYQIYASGRPEQVLNSEFGTEYLPEIEPGDSGRLSAALAGFAAAGIGVSVAVLALIVRLMDRRHALPNVGPGTSQGALTAASTPESRRNGRSRSP